MASRGASVVGNFAERRDEGGRGESQARGCARSHRASRKGERGAEGVGRESHRGCQMKQRPLSKSCAWCKKEFRRREGERSSNYGVRQTCGPACARSFASAQRTPPRMKSRACGVCGSAIEHKPGMGRRTFLKKLTCGRRACVHAVIGRPRRMVTSRPCEACGRILVRRNRELVTSFAERRYCSSACFGATRAQRFDVFGVSMTCSEIAALVGIGVGTIQKRAREGQDLLSGKIR